MRYILVELVWLALALALPAHAQKEFNVWCFGRILPNDGTVGIGNSRAIKLAFDDAGPVQPSDSCIVGVGITAGGTAIGRQEGCGSICDAVGNLLLYSDGVHLYDRLQRVVPGGFRLNDATPFGQFWNGGIYVYAQSLVFVPGPDGLHYVFYWDSTGAAGNSPFQPWCAVVDMRLNGGYGAVVRKQPLSPTYNPRMTAVRHRNNRDFWLITRDLETRGFRAYLIDKKGLNTIPVLSLAENALYPNGDNLKASPSGGRLTCGAYTRTESGSKSCLCVYDFDNTTGTIANELVVRQKPIAAYRANSQGRPLEFTDPSFSSFSPNSNLLYSTELYMNPVSARRLSDLWQYDLTQPTLTEITASRFLVTDIITPLVPVVLKCQGMQLASDGTLWMTEYARGAFMNPATGKFSVIKSPIIRRPNVAGAGCGFELNGYSYPSGHFPLFNFPNVITNMLYAPPTLNYEVGCADDSVQFWASSAGMAAGLRWDFGEPGSGPANAATGGQVAHRYARSGSYAVRLLLADGRVLTQTVTVAAQAVDFTGANVFTPNNDGLNDAFVPVRGALPGGRLRVFSRWGIPVFGTDDADKLRWDGAGAAAGEYFYQLDYPDCQGRTRQRRGVLTLVR